LKFGIPLFRKIKILDKKFDTIIDDFYSLQNFKYWRLPYSYKFWREFNLAMAKLFLIWRAFNLAIDRFSSKKNEKKKHNNIVIIN